MTNHERWPSVTLVVINWNGKTLLERYLPALTSLDYPNYDVLVVDNNSIDGSVSFIKTQYPQIKLLELDGNIGYGPAFNTAVPKIKTDVVILLNNDVEMSTQWLKEFIAPMRQDPSIGVAGCKLLYPDGETIQHAGAELSYPIATSHHRHYKQPDTVNETEMMDVAYVTGAVMAMPRQIFEEVGLFGPEFAPLYYEEVDFCYRVRAAGYRVVYIPTAVAIHHESFTVGHLSEWHLYNNHKNRLCFILKHYTPAQFFDDFVPAELEQLQQPQDSNTLHQLRRAYLAARLALPDVIARDEPRLLARYTKALNQLRATAVAQQPKIETHDPNDPLSAELKQKEALSEFTFPAQSAGLGGLISAARRAWYSVAAKWAVRALAQQQTLFNRLVARLLSDQERLNTATAAEISLLADRLTARDRQDATVDMQAELDALKARVAQLEAALAANAPAEPDPPKRK